MTEVHGLPEPPEGFEWHFTEGEGFVGSSGGYELLTADHDFPKVGPRLALRPKWSLANLKPGDKCRTRNGTCAVYYGDSRSAGYTGQYPLIFIGVDHYSICCEDGRYNPGVEHYNDIVGPWIEPEKLPAEPSNAGTKCDNPGGPCACGAWHEGDKQTIDPGEGYRLIDDLRNVADSALDLLVELYELYKTGVQCYVNRDDLEDYLGHAVDLPSDTEDKIVMILTRHRP